MIGPLGDALLSAEYKNADRYDQLWALGTLAVPALLGTKLAEIGAQAGGNTSAGHAVARVFDDLIFWLVSLALIAGFGFAPYLRRRVTRLPARLPQPGSAGYLAVYWVFAFLASVYMVVAYASGGTFFAGLGKTAPMVESIQVFEGVIHLALTLIASMAVVAAYLCFRPLGRVGRPETRAVAGVLASVPLMAFALSRGAGAAVDAPAWIRGAVYVGMVGVVILAARGLRRLLLWAYRRQARHEHACIRERALAYYGSRLARGIPGSPEGDWAHAERVLFRRLW